MTILAHTLCIWGLVNTAVLAFFAVCSRPQANTPPLFTTHTLVHRSPRVPVLVARRAPSLPMGAKLAGLATHNGCQPGSFLTSTPGE